jgi:hypothetical protein
MSTLKTSFSPFFDRNPIFWFVIVDECATEVCEGTSEAASHTGDLIGQVLKHNGPCTSTAKTNCEMLIRGSRMQMTPDIEMPSREIERKKKPKFYSEKSTVQVKNDTVFSVKKVEKKNWGKRKKLGK